MAVAPCWGGVSSQPSSACALPTASTIANCQSSGMPAGRVTFARFACQPSTAGCAQMRDRAAPAAVDSIVIDQAGAQYALRHRLKSRIEAGAYHQPVLYGGVGAEPADQFAANVFGIVAVGLLQLRPHEIGRDDLRLLARCGFLAG